MALEEADSTLRREAEEQTAAVVRDAQHRTALFEKQAMQAGLEARSMSERLSAADTALDTARTAMREKDIQLTLANKRIASLQKVQDTVTRACCATCWCVWLRL